ncbi:MAG TPA: cation transporter [Ignavibacteria bacterium]|nr:heavy-metal-associated domain-containing protein [Ignavibacteria bacterium]HRE12177.1 cation transporter [Ignavibacteria bacterium]HRF65279.1 cation transporter [Ignavibacteria bacterium]HRJ05181.1 cation transporter [Ignavibacteria bacterium]
MKIKLTLILVIAVSVSLMSIGCGKSENKTDGSTDKKDNTTQSENKTEQSSGNTTLQVSANDKAVEIKTNGMTCTGCENTIKTKVKKVDGVKDVIADFKSNTVKASFDPGKTNPDAIKEAITSAGYKVESIH